MASDLCDTAGQDDYARLRILSYTDANIFLICYSVDSKDSYENVKAHWASEVAHHRAGVPTVLVALKTDMRQMDPTGTLKPADGFNLMKTIKAMKYVECSAQSREGLCEVFQEAAKVVLDQAPKPKKKKTTCVVL